MEKGCQEFVEQININTLWRVVSVKEPGATKQAGAKNNSMDHLYMGLMITLALCFAGHCIGINL